MERASKIILTISIVFFVLTSLIFIYDMILENKRCSNSGGTQLDNMVVPAHNSMFDAYIDKVVKGRNIKELCAKIARYNQEVEADFIVTISMEDGTVLVNSEGFVEELNDETNEIKTIVSTEITPNKNYVVIGKMNEKSGIYNEIIVIPK